MSQLNKAIMKIITGYLVTAVSVGVLVWLMTTQNTPSTCTCRFAQNRVHFGDQYTKTNRKCIDLGGGSVQAGDTVYLDVKWFTNECE